MLTSTDTTERLNSSIAFDEYDLIKSICRESFYEFVKEFWDSIIPDKPVWNWHIKYLCDELQIVAERVFLNEPKLYDLIINISPGSTKSTLCSIMLSAWCWIRKPSMGIIGTSYTSDLAVDLSRKNRTVVRSEKYRAAFPEIIISDEQDAKGHFMNTLGGERNSVGVGGDIMGRHADIIVIDDPLNPKGSRSEADIKSSNNFIKETLWNRKKDKRVTPIILIMQRLHQNDPTAMMLELAQTGMTRVKHICLPGELTNKVSPPELRMYYKDGLMDSVRLSRKVLDEFHIMGEYAYSGQILQSPVPLGGGMFKIEKINIEPAPPPEYKWISLVRYWDKAGTKGGEGAFTAGVKMGVDIRKRFWILDDKRGRWGTEQREDVIKQTAYSDGRRVQIGVEQEPGSGGKESAESTARNLAGFRVRLDRPTGDKALRADPFSVQVNSGNVYMVRGEWNGDYLNEMQYFPYSKYKDQIDASSGAFSLITRKRRVGGLRSYK